MATPVMMVLLEDGTAVDARRWTETAIGAAALVRQGIQPVVRVVKSARQRDRLLGELRADPPRIVFLPVYRGESHPANALLLKLRRASLPTVFMVGGPLGTLGSDVFTFNPVVNAVVLGEWPLLFAQAAARVLDSGSAADIPGVWWRGRGGWQLTPAGRGADSIRDWPAPDWSYLPLAEWMKVNGRLAPLLASVGCPYACTFCSVPKLRELVDYAEKHRRLEPAAVVRQARHLQRVFHAERFVFADDLFPWQPDWVEDFAARWSTEVKAPFEWTTAAEQAGVEVLARLAAAGGVGFDLGVEAGDMRARRRVSDRNTDNDQVKEVIDAAHEHGLRVRCHVIFGLPQTSSEGVRATTELMEYLEPDEVEVHPYDPWPSKTNWSETDHAGLEIVGGSIRGQVAASTRILGQRELAADYGQARDILRGIDTRGRLAAMQARRGGHGRTDVDDADGFVPSVDFDGIAAAMDAEVTSELPHPFRLATYHATNGSHPVAAVRVPTRIGWGLELPLDPVLDFGVLIEPAMPGLRSHEAVLFTIKLRQHDRTYRLFKKVLIQALDPDARRWHWYRLPLAPSQPGPARLMVTAKFFEKDLAYTPLDGDVWVGWAGLRVMSRPSDHLDRSSVEEFPKPSIT